MQVIALKLLKMTTIPTELAKVDGRANEEFSHPSTNTGRRDKASALLCIQQHANTTAVIVLSRNINLSVSSMRGHALKLMKHTSKEKHG